jgi:hypothetical protein
MTRRSLSLALALGAFGGATLVLSAMFFTPGKYLLIPYALVVLGSLVAIRAEGMAAFSERFLTGLVAFVLSSLALYVSVALSPAVARVGVLGHAWRLGLLVGLGALISLATARVAAPPAHRAGAPA